MKRFVFLTFSLSYSRFFTRRKTSVTGQVPGASLATALDFAMLKPLLLTRVAMMMPHSTIDDWSQMRNKLWISLEHFRELEWVRFLVAKSIWGSWAAKEDCVRFIHILADVLKTGISSISECNIVP